MDDSPRSRIRGVEAGFDATAVEAADPGEKGCEGPQGRGKPPAGGERRRGGGRRRLGKEQGAIKAGSGGRHGRSGQRRGRGEAELT